MQREEKSERSRRLVLDTALRLFSTQGYRATSIREIADNAGVSIGNVYHHFPDKETIFRTLLEEYRAITGSESFPFFKALRNSSFPANIEDLAYAARDSVRQFRPYMALIFVDVIEFEGTHIRGFYSELGARFAAIVEEARQRDHPIEPRLRDGVSAIVALQMVTRLFVNYFQLEILFGVSDPFGMSTAEMVRETSDMLRHGIVAPDSETSA